MKDYNMAKPVHFWEVSGFIRISDRARIEFEEIIKDYGVRKLSRDLTLDRETINSLYRKGRRKGAHQIECLLQIAKFLNYNLERLEKEITHYGGKQANMYEIKFPFILTPLYLRAVSIHGDGSFYMDKRTNTIQAEWYQSENRINYMEKLLNKIIKNNPIKSKIKSKEYGVSSITIPAHFIRLICFSLGLDLKDFHSIEFFKRVSELPPNFAFQVFFQFIIDEGHFKGTTLTFSQQKQWSREGFKILLNSLNLKHSDPLNKKQDITIYGINFPIILSELNKATNLYGNVAGFWFKEKTFREICERAEPSLSLRLIKNRIQSNKLKRYAKSNA